MKKTQSGINYIIIKYLIVTFAIAVLFELTIFNYSVLRSFGSKSVSIASAIETNETGKIEISKEINSINLKNVMLSGVELTNCEYAEVTIKISDEGDAYMYELPTFRLVPEIITTGFVNVYPYGLVDRITVEITVPEGAIAQIGEIECNAKRPYSVKLLRMVMVTSILWTVLYIWNRKKNESGGIADDTTVNLDQNGSTDLVNTGQKACKYAVCKKNDKKQLIVIMVAVIFLLILGRMLSVSNGKIVSCPWPHHKQYQELAYELDRGSVALQEKHVDSRLLEKENPYDTGALLAENIPYEMDYAYYNGSYYVYFGIIAELLLYYPYYKLTGKQLSNYNAQYILYVILVLGIFLAIRQFCFRYGKKGNECNVPFVAYMVLCISTVLLSNNVYLISRADIYNIPIMAATGFTWMGIFFWLRGNDENDNRLIRCTCYLLGSFCMAGVAGCRPQMILYSVVALFFFIICEKNVDLSQADSKDNCISIKNRRLFTKDRINETICFCLPYVLVAAVVCWYNAARFGSIFDFGATYSLTSNDMNHRGFNLERLAKGLYAFFLQPAVLTLDFPYLKSSIVTSDYMGKNLTEFMFGGCFATNFMFGVVIVPVFSGFKRIRGEVKSLYFALIAAVLVIASFDVNGAGILYRYTCDFVPGLAIISVIIWIVLIGSGKYESKYAERIMICFVVFGLLYSFMVFMADSGSIGLREDSVVLYEHIREYFRL